MTKPRILIIGSKNHNKADCFDWLQPFPNIEEYDSIIINLQSLTQDVYDQIHNACMQKINFVAVADNK